MRTTLTWGTRVCTACLVEQPERPECYRVKIDFRLRTPISSWFPMCKGCEDKERSERKRVKAAKQAIVAQKQRADNERVCWRCEVCRHPFLYHGEMVGRECFPCHMLTPRNL